MFKSPFGVCVVPVAVREKALLYCAYCGDLIDGEVVRCGCGLTYHRDCAERANWLCRRGHPISPRPPTTTKPVSLPPPVPLQLPLFPPPRPTTRNIPALVLSVAAALALVVPAILLLPAWVKATIAFVALLAMARNFLREMTQEIAREFGLAGTLLIIATALLMFLVLMGGLADFFLAILTIPLTLYIYRKLQ